MKSSDDGLKQRLIGAIVLLALAVIFLPVLFDRKRLEPIDTVSQIPVEPSIKPVIIEPPKAPEKVDFAPEPSVMFVPDTAEPVSPAPESIGLNGSGNVKSWILQVASFREVGHAESLREKLSAEGFSAYTRKLKYKNGSVVRVFVGPKLDKSALVEAQKSIDAKYRVKSMLLEFKPK